MELGPTIIPATSSHIHWAAGSLLGVGGGEEDGPRAPGPSSPSLGFTDSGVVALMSSMAPRRSPERTDWVLLQLPEEAGSLSHGIGAEQAGWGV